MGSRPGCRLSLCTHRDIRTIANILRVDHAGERGAIAIYQAQIWVARRSATDLQEFLATSIDDERRHLMVFEQLMRDRDIIPCRTLSFWGLGGFLLGFTTSLLGRDAILVCTEAVERTVHRHLVDQMDWLATRDVEIVTAITSIQAEELAGVFGRNFVTTFAAVKRAEFATFMRVISPWEREFLLLNV